MFRKILASVAAAALIFGSAAAPSQNAVINRTSITANADSFGDFEYAVLEDGTVEITGYSGSDSEVIIPSEIDGKRVTSIGYEAFGDCTKITSLTIPEGVTSIGDYAFFACEGLTEITLPESVTSIGDWAFYACENLAEITFPSGELDIGFMAFRYTLWLVNMRNEDPLVIVNDILIDGEKCTGNVIIPDGVKRILQSVFSESEGITSISIPASVTDIADLALSDCLSLTEITVDDDNPNYLSDDGVLYNKDQTELIQCPAAKESVSIPESVTVIKLCAFSDCEALTSIDIPNGVKEIGIYAFYNCTGLTSVTIPDSLICIADETFANCSNLTNVVIPEGVASIGEFAFFECTKLKNITIPASVSEIGYRALGYSIIYNDETDEIDFIVIDGFTISGYKGTAAEKYAADNDISFIPLDESDADPKDTDPDDTDPEDNTTPDDNAPGGSSPSSPSGNNTGTGGSGSASADSDSAADTGTAAGAGSPAITTALCSLLASAKKKDRKP